MITDIKEIHELYEILPKKCLDVCHCSGDNYEACKFWVDKLKLNINRDVCIRVLKEYGAWDETELEDDSDKELNIKFLWTAAGYEGEDEKV